MPGRLHPASSVEWAMRAPKNSPHTQSVDTFEEGIQKSYGQPMIAGNFFENFHISFRRLEFEYANPWGLLVGGESLSFNFRDLTPSEGTRSSDFSTPAAATAAAIFQKSPTIGEMRSMWNKVGTFFNIILCAETSIEKLNGNLESF